MKNKDQFYEALLDLLFSKGYRFFPEFSRRLYRQKKIVVVQLYEGLRYGKFSDFVRDCDALDLSIYSSSMYAIYK